MMQSHLLNTRCYLVLELGKKFDDLGEEFQDAVKDRMPVMISEAEPKNIGGSN